MKRRPTIALLLILALPGAASAVCPPSCPIPGGGPKDPATDCLSEFATTRMKLNYPAFNPATPTKLPKMIRCHDGEPGCDTDGKIDNKCVFNVDVCLRNPDPALTLCTPADVTSVTVSPSANPDLAALQSDVNALLPATANVCTAGRTLQVPLAGPNSKGVFRKRTKRVKLDARTASARDVDVLKLTCLPHEWP